MRGILIFCLALGIWSCGGSLSDEQRKSLRKEMEMREIKKVSEEEIFEKAFEMGKKIVSQINVARIDSISKSGKVNIVLADSSTQALSPEQKQILNAYYAAKGADLADNVQNAGDTVIYSSPVVVEGQLSGVWFIHIPRKEIILEL